MNEYLVEHLEEFSARLVNRADDSAATECERLQKRNALETRSTVQTTGNDNSFTNYRYDILVYDPKMNEYLPDHICVSLLFNDRQI